MKRERTFTRMCPDCDAPVSYTVAVPAGQRELGPGQERAAKRQLALGLAQHRKTQCRGRAGR